MRKGRQRNGGGRSGIGMGSGGGGFAWYLDDELDHGTSALSTTFGNPILASAGEFRALTVEAWELCGELE